MLAHACDPSIREIEARRLGVQSKLSYIVSLSLSGPHEILYYALRLRVLAALPRTVIQSVPSTHIVGFPAAWL